jgi:hypothetical protein
MTMMFRPSGAFCLVSADQLFRRSAADYRYGQAIT